MEKGDPTKLHIPAHPITIKEVLSHTSGLILAGDKSLKRTNSLKDDVAQFAAAPLRQEPGTKFEYNNSGINTAARIIEVLSGMSYAEFLQKRVLDPLGLKDTTFWPTEEQSRRLANSAKFTDDKKGLVDIDFAKDLKPALMEKLGHGVTVPHEVLANFGMGKLAEYYSHYADGAGGLFSTASDVAKFAQWLLNKGEWQGQRLLSEEGVKQLGADQTGDVMVNPNESYGLGMFVKKKQDESLSVGSFGHRGARRTVFWVDPTNQLAVVLLVQRMDMDGSQQKEIYGTFFKAAVEKFGKSGPGS
jgi:CubicO group peptidase (beta-lactamase class C family)